MNNHFLQTIAWISLAVLPCVQATHAAGPPVAEKGKAGSPALTGWVQSANTTGYALASEKIRGQLDLTEEQEKKIAALVEESSKRWKDYLERGATGRDKMGAKAFAILTDTQKERLKKLKAVEGSWFSMIGSSRYVGSIGLNKDQVAKIGKILSDHQKERTDAFQSVAKADPDAAKRAKEFQAKHRKMLDEAKAQMREILGANKVDALVTEVARTQFQSIFQQRRYEEQLGLSEDQSAKLSAWIKQRNDAAREIGQIKDAQEKADKWNAWRKESGDKAFGILTEVQREKVKKIPSVEGMWFSALSWPGMIDRLGVGDKTKKKIEEAMAAYQKKRSEAYKPSPKVAAKSREVQEKYKKMVEDAKAEIRKLISDDQFDALLTAIAKLQIPYLYRRDDVAKELALTQEQKENIAEVARKYTEKSRKHAEKAAAERRDLLEQAGALLTPEQKNKLAKLVTSPRPQIRIQGGLDVQKKE